MADLPLLVYFREAFHRPDFTSAPIRILVLQTLRPNEAHKMKDRSTGSSIEAAALTITSSSQIDNYTLWRMSKDVGYEYYRAIRAGGVLPIELARLHLMLNQAQDLRWPVEG
ncbi:hypothetical protein ASD99_02510 [Mesorhizobium sp. Root695]|uniref:hypothetical protein n=1 Tax=unclassified Mesorhizobium TaxID=325217 RepID=UPI0006F65072|nr:MULTISPECIES: hypothetical protein [unclassified Mesorhizobium]KQU87462.1 hypothetical protein ASD12_07995 [Mesorhizobium sp. Root102]KRB34494.1 hypothetical protein ASD99_02510 [Mesorhizobium sp. Root695]